MNNTGRRTAEVSTEPYKVIDWSISLGDEYRFAVIDVEKAQELVSNDENEIVAVVRFGRTRHELQPLADRLNDRFNQALNTKVVTDEDAKASKNTVELDDNTMHMINRIIEGGKQDFRSHIKNHPLLGIMQEVLKETNDPDLKKMVDKFTEEPKDEYQPAKVIEALVRRAYSQGISVGKVKA